MFFYLHAGAMNNSDTSDSKDEDLPLPQLSGVYLTLLAELNATRYLQERVHIPKDGGHLLHISPRTFNALFSKIEHHPVFQNNSDNQQIPVDHQLAVVLYRFGHFGNAATFQKVGLWAGLGYGMVDKCTRQVMQAVCDENFRKVVMRWPNDNQKEDARNWVESHSCPGWGDGWLMVDGTLVPLFARPGFYGNSWYDCKSNYSLNVQLISTPNLHIIDYSVGLPGSQHDATAWKQTRIPLEHETLLGRDGWVWADTAYPLQTWCQAPYKKYVIMMLFISQ
ncbi:hypothetical protein K439DRAFT_1649732 [Ramaria rubella]|nr:hypothetical protein K439DRAFT_1649732 [Ramaria rubella]